MAADDPPRTLATALALVVLGLGAQQLGAGSFFSPVLQDTFVRADQPGMSFGSSPTLLLGDEGDPSSRAVILLQFDLSSIPTNAVVDSATLTLTRSGGGGSSNLNVELLRRTTPWSEGGTTWSNVDPPGSPVIGSAFLDGSGADRTISNPTFRSLVQEWVSSPANNFGFMISPSMVVGGYRQFSSLESGPPPRLNVEFTVPASPDLVVEEIAIESATITQSASFDINAKVTNQGTAAATGATLRYLLSSDPIIGLSDIELGVDAVPPLGAGESSDLAETVIAPATPGSYWVGACVDQPELAEDETNNCSTGEPITVTSQPASTLDVNKAGDGSGQITSDPAGIDCGSTCTAQFGAGTDVTLSATPDPGSTFAGWSGDCSGLVCLLTMDDNRNVTATFTTDIKWTLGVQKSGAGSGQVTSSPQGINCGSTCMAEFGNGETVSLSASPAPGSVFAGWGGACSGTGDCMVLMDQNRIVTVSFLPAVEADFSFSPIQPAVGDPVAFTDTSTGEPNDWEWSFPGGSTSRDQNPVFTFNAAGTFPVSLSVSNGVSVDNTSRSVTVTPETLPLRAQFVFSPTVANVGEVMTFNASGSTGNPTTFDWTFGDGTAGTGQVTEHAYSAPGSFEVALEVSNGSDSDSSTLNVTVVETIGVEADFSFAPEDPVAGQEIAFKDLSTVAPRTGCGRLATAARPPNRTRVTHSTQPAPTTCGSGSLPRPAAMGSPGVSRCRPRPAALSCLRATSEPEKAGGRFGLPFAGPASRARRRPSCSTSSKAQLVVDKTSAHPSKS